MCGSTSLQRRHVYRQMYDFDGGRMKIITYGVRITQGICKKCGAVTIPDNPCTAGTAFGPKALGIITKMYYLRMTDKAVSYEFESMFHSGTSENAIWNARKAASRLLRPSYGAMLDRMASYPYVHMDESPIKIDGRRGQV